MVEELRALTKRVVEEVWNKGNVDVLDEGFAADVVTHQVPFPDIEGLDAYKQNVRDSRTTLPDLQMTMDELMMEEDRWAGRWTIRGTHKGQSPALPIPPTGKQVVLMGCSMGHMVGGKTVEQWMYGDWLGMLQQLGVVPQLGEGSG